MLRSAAIVTTFILCSLALTAPASAKSAQNNATTMRPSAFAVSRPVSDLPIDFSFFPGREMPEPLPSSLRSHATYGPWQLDPVLQKEVLPQVSATKGIDFEGIPAQNYAPSDSNMAVGPNHIVETVNVRLAVYSKTGALLSGPTDITTFFAPLGGDCAAGASDPIVLYDRLADRWLISDVGIGSQFSECVGVSKTNDPTGAYVLYAYSFGGTLNDYPKLGVWPTSSNSSYLASYNLGGGAADICGLDRTKMLAGDSSASQLCQRLPFIESSYLPSDIDGPTAPVDGTPGLFMTWQNNNPGQLRLRKLTLDFAAGTSSVSSAINISVANDNLACGSCVPQLGTTEGLDTLGDRMMYRFPIRHFADHDRAVLNHAVTNGGQVAFRWYEVYDPAGAVTVNQQGTFAPDSTYRWMASIAEDKNGDIGVGYSASDSTIHPAIRFTGRVPGDPLGSLESEASIVEGAGSQTSGLSRWGDYTAMVVDPSDDCTFWYVDQYQQTDGTFNWNTHIGSFAFNTCSGGSALTFAPTSLKWGKVVVGVKGATKKVTVTNSGTATVNITKIAATGDFALVAVKATRKVTPCVKGSAIAPGANCIVKVSFTPSKTGLRTGSLNFTDDAPGSPQSVSLSGTGK